MRYLTLLAVLIACGDDDGTIEPDTGPADVGVDAPDIEPDAGTDAGADAGTDAGMDAGTDAGSDAGTDAASDVGTDTAVDVGTDTAVDVGTDAGFSELTVSGIANIYGAGMIGPPGGGALPPMLALPAGSSRVMSLTASGSVSYLPGFTNGPDGIAAVVSGPSPDINGLAGPPNIDRGRCLYAVFLDDATPMDPAPAKVTQASSADTPIAPLVAQIFFVGDGLTGEGAGASQMFQIPDEATRVFFGLYDTGTWGDPPTAWTDNGGEFQVQVTIE